MDKSPDTSSSTPKCLQNVKSFKSANKAEADVKYQSGSNGIPFFEEDLAYLPGAATAAMAEFNRVLSSCGDITFGSGGYTFAGTVGQMSFPAFGAQSSAYQLNLSTKASGLNLTFGFDVIAIRFTNDEAVVVLYGDLGTPDLTELQQLVQKATQKITASVGSG